MIANNDDVFQIYSTSVDVRGHGHRFDQRAHARTTFCRINRLIVCMKKV
jgi:hypothetical protein